MPLPMPVVMDHVVFVRALRGRALPESVIKPGRNRHGLAVADGWTLIIVPGAREGQFANLAGMQRVDRFDQPGIATPLVAHLHDTIMLSGGLEKPFAFLRIVAARLLDI